VTPAIVTSALSPPARRTTLATTLRVAPVTSTGTSAESPPSARARRRISSSDRPDRLRKGIAPAGTAIVRSGLGGVPAPPSECDRALSPASVSSARCVTLSARAPCRIVVRMYSTTASAETRTDCSTRVAGV
jgi:hypothetical protein